MRKRLWTLCFGLILAASAARAEFAAQYNFQDFTQTRQAVKAVYITPLWNVTVNNTTNIAVGQRQSKQTDSAGSLVVSNMIYGAYLVEFIGPTRTNRFTNCFDSSISPGSLVNSADYICVGTNATDTSGYAYTQAQSNQRFMTNAVHAGAPGYVLTATDTSGNYDWELSGGSGGGITLAQGTNIVDGSGGVIATNGSHTTFKFSSTGTNVINSLAAVAATAATNGYPWGALYDALNAALNATNGIGLPSGLSAFRPTNSFASSNIATTSLNGIARPDGSTITITAGGVMSAVTGGSGNVTGSGSTATGEVPTFNNGSATGIQGGGVLLANVTTNTGNLSGMVKGNGARGLTGASAGSDYVAPATTLTINGTANQITSSAGAQDLSGNRTWTFSLPTTLIVPGTLNVTGDQTNQGNLSITGNQTNFAKLIASKIWGSLNGILRETNTIASAGVQGLIIGENTPNSFLTGGSPGAELLQQRLAYTGWWGIDPNNIATLWKVGTSESSTIPDMAWNFQSAATATYSDTAHVAKGAPATLSAPYISGSASSMIDLPTHGPEIWAAKKHPWIGLNTALGGQSLANWRTFQITYTNLPNVARWLNTNGTVAQLSQYGIQMGIWGDTGAFTNRTSGGALQFDPWILTSSGFSNESNYVYAIHTNGLKLSLANYRSTYIVNPFNGDTQRVQTNGSQPDLSFPSGLGGWTGAVWASITPETVEKDMLWYYSNRVDEIFLQNINEFEMFAGYEQQVYKFAYAALYLGPGTHLYWADNNGLSGQNPIGPGPYTFPRAATQYTNQMILGWFADFPSSQLQYSINDVSPNQQFTRVGSEPGLAEVMGLARTYHETMSNWDNPVFPSFPEATEANDSSLSKTSITNFLSGAEMFRANITFEIATNTWSWNTNIQQVLTNAPLYLSTWQDTMLLWPLRMFDDGTNSLWVRPIDNGAFLVLAAAQGAASSNFNYTVCAPIKGIATNVVYNATNVLTGTAYGSGYLTNKFIGTVTTNALVYIRLTPALPQTRVFNADNTLTVTATNRPDGGVDYGAAIGAVVLTNNWQNTLTNAGALTNVGPVSITGNETNFADTYLRGSLVITGGTTNNSLSASADVQTDANKKLTSTANAFGVKTNDGSGNLGYSFKPILDLSASTNSITWSNALTVTNFPVVFDGGLHEITVTNGPDVFISVSGTSGSVSFQIESNVTLHLPAQTKWLTGSNSVATNAVLSMTSYGATNRLRAAMREVQ